MSQHPDAGPALSARLLRDLQDAIGEATSALAHRLRMSATDAAAEDFSPAQQDVIAAYLRAVTSAYRAYAAAPDDAQETARPRR